MSFTAHELYGGPAPAQPDPAAAETGAPAPSGEPGGRTVARPRPGITGNPTILLVGLLGLAAVLVGAVRVEVK